MVSARAGQEFFPGGRYAVSAQAHRQTGERTPEEAAEPFLQDTLRDIALQEENRRRWESLTPREKDAAAFICLGYTSRPVGMKLDISFETVKTHAGHIMMKFAAPSREALRKMLHGWDFRQWD